MCVPRVMYAPTEDESPPWVHTCIQSSEAEGHHPMLNKERLCGEEMKGFNRANGSWGSDPQKGTCEDAGYNYCYCSTSTTSHLEGFGKILVSYLKDIETCNHVRDSLKDWVGFEECPKDSEAESCQPCPG